jgi:hypothetical protein
LEPFFPEEHAADAFPQLGHVRAMSEIDRSGTSPRTLPGNGLVRPCFHFFLCFDSFDRLYCRQGWAIAVSPTCTLLPDDKKMMLFKLRHVGMSASQGYSSHLNEYDFEEFFGGSGPGRIPDINEFAASLDLDDSDPAKYYGLIQASLSVINCSHLIIDKLNGRKFPKAAFPFRT